MAKEANIDQDLNRDMKLMVVLVVLKKDRIDIATPATVQVIIFYVFLAIKVKYVQVPDPKLVCVVSDYLWVSKPNLVYFLARFLQVCQKDWMLL